MILIYPRCWTRKFRQDTHTHTHTDTHTHRHTHTHRYTLTHTHTHTDTQTQKFGQDILNISKRTLDKRKILQKKSSIIFGAL